MNAISKNDILARNRRKLMEHFEIGRVLHLKSEIRNFGLDSPICDFGFRI